MVPLWEPPAGPLPEQLKEQHKERPGKSGLRPRILIALWRAARVALHLAQGIVIATQRMPGWSNPQRNVWIQHWSATLLRILAIRLHVSGAPPDSTAPLMIVANHISWIDVHVLNAICPARFVAKSEIRRWPLIGHLARQAGTVFIERARQRDILRVNRALAALMRAGAASAVFPEGTTTEGGTVLPFRPALLQAAINCGARLQPVALGYRHADGRWCSQAGFTGDTSFITSLWRVLSQAQIHAHLQFLPAAACSGQQRKILARNARQQIQSALAQPAGCRPDCPTCAAATALRQTSTQPAAPATGRRPLVGAVISRMPGFR